MAAVRGCSGSGCDSFGGRNATTAGLSALYGLGRYLCSVCRQYDTFGADSADGGAVTSGDPSGSTTGGGHSFGPPSETGAYGSTTSADCAVTTVGHIGGSSNGVGRNAHEQPASRAPTP